MKTGNILSNIPEEIPEELIEIISSSDNVRIERIISQGHSSPNNYWYDQIEDEFVVLLEGSATLEFENNKLVQMGKGDYLVIPKHKKHRVAATDSKIKTIWLAVFY